MRVYLIVSLLVISAVSAFGITEELYWDDGVAGTDMQNGLRAVMFTMPFAGDVITARFYLSGDAGYDDAFDILITPVSGNMPDEGNPYGYFDYVGGDATGEGWLDVDITPMNVSLPDDADFFLVFDPQPAGGTPHIHHDGDSDGSHNRWRSFTGGWQTSSLPAYMLRVIVDDGEVGIESASLGEIKAVFK